MTADNSNPFGAGGVRPLELAPQAWQVLFDRTPGAMALVTPEGLIRAANPACCELVGATEAELRASGLALLLAAPEVPAVLDQLRHLAATAGPTDASFSVRCRGPQGPIPGVAELTGPLPGGPEPFLLLQLQVSRQAGADPGEGAAQGYALTALNGEIEDCNGAFARLLGATPPELVGGSLLALVDPDDRPATQEAFSRLITGVSAVEHLEQRHLRGPGQTVWVELRLSLERNAAGEPVRLCACQRDISGRRQALEALCRKHDLLARVTETCPVGLLATNAAGICVFANEGAEQLLGAPREAIVNQPYDPTPWQVTTLEGVPIAPDQLPSARVRAGAGVLRNQPVACTRPDGRHLFLNLNLAPILAPDGSCEGLVLSLEDMTERVKAEAALRESEQRYRELVDNANSIILRTGLDWRVHFANEYAQRFFGYNQEELAGRSVFETIVPSLESTGRDLTSLLEGIAADPEQYGTNVNENVTADGRRVWIAWSNRVTRNAAGEITGLLCVGTDLTELREATERLREQEERYRTFIDSTDDAVFLRDEQGRYVIVNEAMARLLGVPEEQIVGRLDAEVDSPASGASLTGVPDEAGRLLREVSWRARAFEVREFPVRLAGGRPGVGGYIRDITERQRAADNVRLAAVGQLAGGVAHDFNNMLTALKMRADLSRGARSLEAYRELIDLVMVSVDHGARICRSLMDFARPEEPCRVPVRIDECLEAAIALLSSQFDTAGVVVRRDYAPASHVILGDAGQLQQVFVTLLSNACHAMPHGGDLEIVTRYGPDDHPEAVVISVTDHGTGIAPENLRRVFEPFFTTKGRLGESEVPGSGLGLAAAHGIVTAHDGSIDVNSTVGQGSTFTVRLPLGEALPAETPGLQGAAGLSAGRSAHVLVADDDTGIRDVIGQILELAGHRVTMAGRAAEALQAIGEQAPDLAIVDLMMPGGGRQVLEAVRQLPAPPPVILITGRLEPAIHRELIGLGASVCLPKPFGADILLSVVDELLRTKTSA